MANLSYGSYGSEVKRLQNTLNAEGYSLSEDGQFGAKTQAAVKDYQRKNGLSVDGIVGVNTWGKLGSANNAKSSSTKNAVTTGTKGTAAKSSSSSARPTYKPSSSVSTAEKALKDWENQKPGDYSSKYSDRIDSLLGDILDRKDFSYDMNTDPLYQQMKTQYTENGRKAMMDTAAKASALSGGYANSYAVTAGNEAYQSFLQKLGDTSLDLRDRAYAQYKDKGDSLISDVTLLRSLDGDDYKKYRDQLSDYYDNGDYLLDKLTSMSDAEYKKFTEQVKEWESDRDYARQVSKDKQTQQNFKDEMTFKKSEAEREQSNADRTYALSRAKAVSSGSSSRSSSTKSTTEKKAKVTKYTVFPKTYNEFVDRSGYGGILTESEFNNNGQVSRKYGSYQKYLERMYYQFG